MRGIVHWLGKVPHLFGKCMVITCLLGGTGSVAWAFRILSHTDNDPTGALTAALAFFGGELMIMASRDVFSKKQTDITKPEGF